MSALALPVEEDYGPFERVDLPNTTLYYRDENHSYWQDCKRKPNGEWSGSGRLTGVSTVIAPWDWRPDSLMRWVEKLTLEGIVRGFEGHTVPRDPFALRTLLEQRGLRWEQIRDEAGVRGTNAHELMLHALAKGETVPNLDELPADQRGYGQGVLKWWSDRNPQVTHAEQIVCSPEHGIAGRFDLRCTVKDPFRAGTGIVDLKTSGFIAVKSLVQPAGYDLGGLASGLWGEPADWYMVLQVDERGGYLEVPSPATHDDFLLSLSLYRRAAELGKAAKAARA